MKQALIYFFARPYLLNVAIWTVSAQCRNLWLIIIRMHGIIRAFFGAVSNCAVLANHVAIYGAFTVKG